jgi:predicted Zn-dependent protease with MMP-like domain
MNNLLLNAVCLETDVALGRLRALPRKQGRLRKFPPNLPGTPMRTNRPGIGADAFARLVEQAIARIPEEIRAYLDNVVISVKRRPSLDLLAEMGLAPDEPLFGVYLGVPLTERSVSEPPLYPDAIHIFQEPLEACCATREELLEEIEITVVHEIAHFFGFSDEELEALGYG